MIEPDAFRLPRIRLLDPRAMRFQQEPLAAVAKAGGQVVRLQCHGGDWVVTAWSHHGKIGTWRPEWHRPLGPMSRDAAIAAFMTIVAQLRLFHATVVIGTAAAIRP